jgi:hypothetical protein
MKPQRSDGAVGLAEGKGTLQQALDERLVRCQRRLEQAIHSVSDERALAHLASALAEIDQVRWEIVRPRASDKRHAPRFRGDSLAIITIKGRGETAAVIRDISTGGAILEIEDSLIPGELYLLRLTGIGTPLEARVLSHEEGWARVAFTPMPVETAIELAKHLERRVG